MSITAVPLPKDLLASSDARTLLQNELSRAGVAYSPGFLTGEKLKTLIRIVLETKASAPPNWQPICHGSDNFYWINDHYSGSTVQGAFSQVNFFPWNSGSKQVFDLTGDVLRVRNLLLGQGQEEFFSPQQGDEATVRIAAQFYPSGKGWMQEHRDPEGPHQTVLASLVLSSFGTDYESGGLFVRNSEGQKFFPEASLSPGDLLWFSPSVSHGVDKIEPIEPEQKFADWAENDGRWMLLFATNALSNDLAFGRAEAVDS